MQIAAKTKQNKTKQNKTECLRVGTTESEVDVIVDDVTYVDRDRCVALARVVPTNVDDSRPVDELAVISLLLVEIRLPRRAIDTMVNKTENSGVVSRNTAYAFATRSRCRESVCCCCHLFVRNGEENTVVGL